MNADQTKAFRHKTLVAGLRGEPVALPPYPTELVFTLALVALDYKRKADRLAAGGRVKAKKQKDAKDERNALWKQYAADLKPTMSRESKAEAVARRVAADKALSDEMRSICTASTKTIKRVLFPPK